MGVPPGVQDQAMYASTYRLGVQILANWVDVFLVILTLIDKDMMES